MQPSQSCVNCHFLQKSYVRHGGEASEANFHVSAEERELVKREDYSWHQRTKQLYNLECFMDVWTEGYQFDHSKLHNVLVETDRRHFCFFWKFRPGMLMPAARTLQERDAAHRRASRDRRLTLIALFIAAIALLVDVILRLMYE